MSEAKPFQPEWHEPKPQAKGSGLKWVLMGCGGLMLVTVLLCAGVSFWGYRWVSQQVTDFTEPLVAQGYEKQTGQVIQVDQSPQTKTVYVSQMLTITKDVNVDIAAAAQVMEVKANIHGDVDFLGQMLKVHSGSVIDGDLRVKTAQVIEIQGEVKGKISGNYQALIYGGKNYGPGQSPSSDSDKAEKADPEPEKAAPPAPQAPEAPAPPTPEPAPAEAPS